MSLHKVTPCSKVFELKEVTKPQQSFGYVVPSNTQLTFIFVATIEADVHVSVRLTGKGARATVIGLVFARKDQRITIHTEQIHEAPETTSNLLVKAVLRDEASFAYDGIIRVERKAQKSDAYQKNENLLLSPHAKARSDPALEILANDVRCTHGSTSGTLNKEQLWYLTSRAVPRAVAASLLVEGFFESAISRISDTIQQDRIRKILWDTL